MIVVLEYLDEAGRSPFERWRSELDAQVRVKVSVAVARVANGNISSVKGVGHGVAEIKIDFGPGYRFYFGRDGDAVIVLLGGGSKKRQQTDIAKAHERWADYKNRKKQGA